MDLHPKQSFEKGHYIKRQLTPELRDGSDMLGQFVQIRLDKIH